MQCRGGAALASRVAQTCLIMGQGFLANRSLFGWMSAEQYLDTVALALGSSTPQIEVYSAIT